MLLNKRNPFTLNGFPRRRWQNFPVMTFERPNIEKMQGYTPGEQPDDGDSIKLNTNENPYPASPEVAAALRNIEVDSLRRYPAPLADQFRQAAASLHQVSEHNIIPTNGGDELLRLVLTTFVDSGETIAITKPSYSLYPVLADIAGCKLAEIDLQADWSMPKNFLAQLQQAQARITILVNPQAPTGSLISVAYLDELAGNYNGVLVVDEAYVDFIDPELGYDSIPLIGRHQNLLILRSLSKGYGLAGLRFGYGIACESLVAPMLTKTRDSYNTDTISQSLAAAALDSVDHARQGWVRIRSERSKLLSALAQLGLPSLPSQSNFLLCEVPQAVGAENLYQSLKRRGILVRYFDQDRLRDRLRISIGSEEDNATLVTALKAIFEGEVPDPAQ
jgi:histidinol-phosphate aminotransferase